MAEPAEEEEEVSGANALLAKVGQSPIHLPEEGAPTRGSLAQRRDQVRIKVALGSVIESRSPSPAVNDVIDAEERDHTAVGKDGARPASQEESHPLRLRINFIEAVGLLRP